MLTAEELKQLVKQSRTAPFSVLREYYQTLFLSYLSQNPHNSHLIFKGGTCIRLLYQGNRFSEDLDFTVTDLNEVEAAQAIETIVTAMSKETNVKFKPVKSIAGRCFKITFITPLHPQPIVIKIDLSFRDFLGIVESTAIQTRYPILFNQLIYHYPKEAILAEKVHAINHRTKGRDLYDIWFLISMLTPINHNLINKKLSFFKETFNQAQFTNRIIKFPLDSFVSDLNPFINDDERSRLKEIHQVITTTLPSRLTQQP